METMGGVYFQQLTGVDRDKGPALNKFVFYLLI